MPALDSCHFQIVHALQREGWHVSPNGGLQKNSHNQDHQNGYIRPQNGYRLCEV